MLANATRICEAKFGVLQICEGDGFRAVALHDVPPAYTERRRDSVLRPGPEHPLGRVVRTKHTIHVADILAEPEVARGGLAELAGARTILNVPMLKENELIGVISIYRQEVRPFTDKQIELVENFAAQAVIAIENTRLLSELRESLQQQTATADVLKIISSSPGELEPVFRAMLENATRICEAKIGILFRYKNGAYTAVATLGVAPAYAEYLNSGPIRPGPTTGLGRVADTRQTIHVVDTQAEGAYAEREPLRVATAELGGARSLLNVPMLKEGELIGAIGIYRQEVRPFTDKQIELVTNFAAQAVIAIENTRLLNELRQRTDDLSEALEQQTATSEVLKVISSSPGELEPVFEAMLENAVKICDAKFGNLFLREGDVFRIGATYGAPPAYVDYLRSEQVFQLNPKLGLGLMVKTKEVYQLADMAAVPTHGAKLRQATINLAGARTLIGIPMLKDNEVIGAIIIYRQEVRPFTDKQIQLVKNFAAQAVIAIENTRLLNELRQRTDDLSEALQQQTGTSEVLRVISSSPGDVAPVFGTMLEKAVRICDASFGMLFRAENGVMSAAAMLGVPPAFAEFWQRGPQRPGPRTAFGRTVETRQAVHIVDVRTDPAYVDGEPVFVAAVKLGGFRTILNVPMLKDNELIGVFAIYRQEVRAFTDKQIELVKNFAAQAVIAIENARLLAELRARTNELSQSVGELQALGEVSQAVNSTLDLETVLTTIVGRAVQLSRTDAGTIYVFDDERKEFHLRATYGMSEAMIAAIADQHIGLGDTNMGTATTQRKPIQVSDIRNQPSAVNEIILREGYRSILMIPLLRPDHIVGALVVRRKTPGEFPQSTIELLQTFADQSVVAIQNARLYESVEARTRELAKSLEDLRTTQDRLVQTQKLASLGQLTAGIAHEIKNPLNFVNNFSGVSAELIDELQEALKDVSLNEKRRKEINELTNMLRGNLDKVVQHGKRADAIVKNMLLHSREGSGEHRLVDINALVEESLNLAYHGARAEKQGFNITLERSFDPDDRRS